MNFSESYKQQLIETIDKIDDRKVSEAAAWLAQARDEGRHIFVCGNGGRAAISRS